MSAAQARMEDIAANPKTLSTRWRLALAAGLVALGDFLLFRQSLGLSLALFIVCAEVATILAAGFARDRIAICAVVGIATLAPLVEDVGALSLVIAVCGAGAVALIANGNSHGSFAARTWRVLRFLAAGPVRILIDIPKAASAAPSRGRVKAGGRVLAAWLLPVALGGVFLALFSAANPVVEAWLADLDIRPLLALVDAGRLAFWLVVLTLVWPLVVHRQLRPQAVAGAAARGETMGGAASGSGGLGEVLFGESAVLRSLILFNLMFAVQTALDIAILWRGRGLPSGVSFASYAHRGAYPLVVTALLAAAFVTLVMRPGSATAGSKSIRALVFVWAAQNIALVVSSLYRLDLYVQVYSLTYWRVAAFVWMGLVAVGLVLIVVQLATRRSNRWLVSANAIAATAALYVCALVNFDYLIAAYNIRHCAQVAADSAALDIDYLRSLGPNVIPALDEALAAGGSPFGAGRLRAVRSTLRSARLAEPRDWRAWTYRGWRLSQYLESDGETSSKP